MGTTLTSPFSLLRHAWSLALARANIFSYLILGLIPQLLSFIISVLVAYFSGYDLLSNIQGWMVAGLLLVGLLALVVVSLASTWYTALLYIIYQATAAGSLVRVSAYIRPARQVTIRLLKTYIIVGLITSLGFLLLVIPGIIFAVRFMFAPMIAAVEDASIKPVEESKRLVKGRFWQLVGRSVILALSYSIPRTILQSIHPFLGAVWSVSAPVFGLSFFLMYLDFKQPAVASSQ